jgi:hypothetical protein
LVAVTIVRSAVTVNRDHVAILQSRVATWRDVSLIAAQQGENRRAGHATHVELTQGAPVRLVR